MLDLTVNREVLLKNIDKARNNGVIIPTLSQMRDPGTVPLKIREKLKGIGLWDVDPLNLFRITWKNEPKEKGGLFGGPNYIELPPSLTGVPARIFCLVGKWFPTGCHKVGAAFGCLVPKLVTGLFDSTLQKAVWPSTGNYCRGGAFNSKLLSVDSVAVLPEGMSRERFDWLSDIAGEVIATPGTESNVKEIFDKVKELRETRRDVMIFNQFEEPGNYLWHYHVTGGALSEAFETMRRQNDRFFGACFTTGSAGTIACGDHLKKIYPGFKIAAGEALQCPTILNNGFGAHRIEGIGDKHIPWIHNVKNTDLAIAVDDRDAVSLFRLISEPEGRSYLENDAGVDPETISRLDLPGISGVANIICCIKTAKYFELTENDVLATVLTDSSEMYGSRLEEMREKEGAYSRHAAAAAHGEHMLGIRADNMLEMTYPERRRVHNLKYYTWAEQQGKTADEVNALWYDEKGTWESVRAKKDELDELINEFNRATGLLEAL
ncbi:MAG: pyridoxal-phosphate dependent enzyme [Oscillospiraceae bacterium]|nr:pyridoxal-phosphate dependent enzyme [Oscillospiraceae bacterium]